MNWILTEPLHFGVVFSEDPLDIVRGAVPCSNPDDLGRKTEKEAPLPEVGILGHNYESVLARVLPNSVVVRPLQAEMPHVAGTGIQGGDSIEDPRRDVLIK